MRTLGLAGAVIALALTPAAARADLLAVTEAQGPGGDLDLAQVNVSTGQLVSLPAGVNTAADEFHPSLSFDGTKLVFERVDAAAGTTRFVMVDLGTGTSSDLLSAFQVSMLSPSDPDFVSAHRVALGRSLEFTGTSASSTQVRATHVDTSSFPSGPYPTSEVPFRNETVNGSGRSLDFDRQGRPVAGVRFNNSAAGAVVSDDPGRHVLEGNDSLDNPTVSLPQGVVVLTRSTVSSNGTLGTPQLVSLPLDLQGPTSALPPIVQGSVTRPEFTDDGRYLAFVRQEGSQFKLFVWDTQTQLLLDDAGVGLGALSNAQRDRLRIDGSVTLHRTILILASALRPGLVTFQLTLPSSIGIIVERVVGRTHVLGHPAPKLRLVGRVPLGRFSRGHGHVRWNRRVNGRRLKRGRYLVTVRSVTRSGRVRDLGHPVKLRIR